MFKINLPLERLQGILLQYKCPNQLREYTLASLKLKPANDRRINVKNPRVEGWKFTETGNIFATTCLVDYESERPDLFKGIRDITELVLVYIHPEWQKQNLGKTITRNTYESLSRSETKWIRIRCCVPAMEKIVRKTLLTTNRNYEVHEDSEGRRDYWIINPNFMASQIKKPQYPPSNVIQLPFARASL